MTNEEALKIKKAMTDINNMAVSYIENGPYENDMPGMEFAVKIDQISKVFCEEEDHLPDATKMMPLTLEQLRQMEKPTPVWAKPKKKTIEAWDGYWCICHRGHIITPGMVSMYADKMNGVTFYAYPPSRIDREAWVAKWEWFDEEIGNPIDGIEREWGWKCSKCGNALPDDFDSPDDTPKIEFCPFCGCAMTPRAWAELEKRLRG